MKMISELIIGNLKHKHKALEKMYLTVEPVPHSQIKTISRHIVSSLSGRSIKWFSFTMIMLLACVCYGQIKTGIYRPTLNSQPVGDSVTLCYEICNDVNTAGVVQPSDFNDANTVLYNGTKPFVGSLYSIYIDPNGTDTSFKISLWFKPVNPQSTSTVTDANYSDDFTDYEYVKVAGCEFTLNAADANNFWYPLEFSSYTGNVYAGYKRTGYWMVHIEDADDTPRTLNRCKINIEGKLEDVD